MKVLASFARRSSVLSLLAVLALGALAAPRASARSFDGALNWIPTEVSMLVAVDLEGARATAFFKDLQKEIIDLTGYGRDIAQMKREAGLDVMSSVKSVLYAGPDDVIRKAKQSLVVLEGSFDQAKIREYYEKKSNLPLVEKTSPVGPYFEIGGDACVAFNGDYAVFGSKALFEKALAARAANEGGKKAKVASLVGRFKGSRHGFGVIAGSAQLQKFLGKDFAAVQDVRGAALGLDFSSGFGLRIVGLFADAGKASSVAQSVRTELAELLADPELKELGIDGALSQVAATSSGSEVKIELALDASGASSFAKSLKELF
jgi:hypothetical protein